MEEYLRVFLPKIAVGEEDTAFFVGVFHEIARKKNGQVFFDLLEEQKRTDFVWDWTALEPRLNEIAALLRLHVYTVTILFFFCASPELHEKYQKEDISDRIYYDTLKDLTYKLEECKLCYGIRGTFVGKWFVGYYRLERFHLCRLQFEERPFGYNQTVDGVEMTETSPVLNTHIPRTGTPMDKKSCDESYREAKEFFSKHFPKSFPAGKPTVFVCKSWLLDPLTRDCIREGSNIGRFRDEFKLVDAFEREGNPDLWRLFDTMETDYTKLPEDTSVRRAYKAHLLAGGKTGVGYGAMVLR